MSAMVSRGAAVLNPFLLIVIGIMLAVGALLALRSRARRAHHDGMIPDGGVVSVAGGVASHGGRLAALNTAVVAAALIAVVGALVSNGGLAVFTDTATVPSNTFTTGTVDISTSPTSALVTFSTMAPGDVVTNPLTVTNAGTLALRYAVASTTTENTLAGVLDLTIKSGVTTCTNAGFAGSGTVVYATGDLGNTTAVNVIGDATQGSQTGDRTLAASASEALCFNVSLPLAATNTVQGLTSTATFAFAAEQTTNNP